MFEYHLRPTQLNRKHVEAGGWEVSAADGSAVATFRTLEEAQTAVRLYVTQDRIAALDRQGKRAS